MDTITREIVQEITELDPPTKEQPLFRGAMEAGYYRARSESYTQGWKDAMRLLRAALDLGEVAR
jgi:hypothetical protein